MKFTLNTLGAPTWTLEDTAMHARAYGYAGVDLRLLDGKVISLDSVRANRARIKELFAADELPVASLQTSVRLATREPQIRQAALEEGTAWIDLAASGHRQTWPQLKSWIGDVRCRRRSVRAQHHEPDPTSQPQHGAPVHSQYRHSAQDERDAVYRAVGIRYVSAQPLKPPVPVRFAYQLIPENRLRPVIDVGRSEQSRVVLFLEVSLPAPKPPTPTYGDELVSRLSDNLSDHSWTFTQHFEENRLRVFARIGSFRARRPRRRLTAK